MLILKLMKEIFFSGAATEKKKKRIEGEVPNRSMASR